MQTSVRPLNRFRLTYANSVVKVSGVFVSRRSPSSDLLVGTEGVDFFLGGRVYVVSDATAAALSAAGFTTTPDAGYGVAPFGSQGFGD